MKPDAYRNTNQRDNAAVAAHVVRVSAANTGSADCPKSLSINARPALRDRSSPPFALRDFALGPLMSALDRAEFDGQDDDAVVEELIRTRGTFNRQEAPAHPGLVSWSVEAFRNYRAAWRARQANVETRCPRPVQSKWTVVHHRDIPDHRGVFRYEQTCWGRRYQSDDDAVREMWLLGQTTPKNRPSAVYAMAANVAAFGGSESPDRVRVVDFGAMSPAAKQRCEWPIDEVRRQAREQSTPRLLSVVDATERRAGGECAQCSLARDCAALPSVDLLPDVPAARGPRRALSVTDLRHYKSCPARYHLLMQLHIRDVETVENEAITVGRAVDNALRQRHACGDRPSRCAPDHPVEDVIAALPEESRRSATKMLAHHAVLCPFPDVEPQGGKARNRVVFHDQRLGVVFIADPDLLYLRSGGWVWRETKTSSRRLSRHHSLLEQVPQVALAVLILASGVLDGDVARSRVEFEQLRSDGRALEEVDPGNRAVVAEARQIIGGMVGRLLADRTFEPSPGRDCKSCEVRRWCEPGSRYVTENAGALTS